MKDQNSIEEKETKSEKWERGKALFLGIFDVKSIFINLFFNQEVNDE